MPAPPLLGCGGAGGGGGGGDLKPDVSRKVHTRVLGPGTFDRRDGHFQRVLQQYCVHKQKRICSILPRPKRGARAWRRSPGAFGA